jgi:hypothetical protein
MALKDEMSSKMSDDSPVFLESILMSGESSSKSERSSFFKLNGFTSLTGRVRAVEI